MCHQNFIWGCKPVLDSRQLKNKYFGLLKSCITKYNCKLKIKKRNCFIGLQHDNSRGVLNYVSARKDNVLTKIQKKMLPRQWKDYDNKTGRKIHKGNKTRGSCKLRPMERQRYNVNRRLPHPRSKSGSRGSERKKMMSAMHT